MSETRDTKTQDTKSKGYNFIITGYGDDIDTLSDKSRYPDWVKSVAGGVESCPTTGRSHFQGAVICVRQVRFSAVKKWLPSSHIEVARDKNAVVSYCMKSETAVGEKIVRQNENEYVPLHVIIMNMGIMFHKEFSGMQIDDDEKIDEYRRRVFTTIANRMVYNDFKLITVLSNPQAIRMWSMFFPTILKKAKENILREKDVPPVEELGDSDSVEESNDSDGEA